MEGDDRLAGAGAALHDEHPGLRGPDDLVLLRLDGGDDVAQRAGAPALECRQQRRVAAQRRAPVVLGGRGILRILGIDEALVVADAEVPATEQLVLDAQHGAALDGEVAAPHQPHRLATGGPVERLGNGCPPVDDDRLGLRVGDGEAADVEALGGLRALGVTVDATEHQRGVTEVEVGEPLDQGLVEGVALEAGLERASQIGLVEVPQPPRRLAGALQALVGVIDVGLFGGEFWVLLRHSSAQRGSEILSGGRRNEVGVLLSVGTASQ